MEQTKKETAPSLVIRRVVRAKRDRVFEAWSDPEIMKQWFYCQEGSAKVTNDFRVGGTYENEMTHIQKNAEDAACTNKSNVNLHKGEYLEIIPPEKIVFTWNSAIVTNSVVTIELKDLGDSTEVWITHDNLETQELKDMHAFGWEGCLENLQTFMEE